MASSRYPVCPVCITDMAFAGIVWVTFSGGSRDLTLRFSCDACHVEMNTAARNVPASHGVPDDGAMSGQAA